MSKPKRYDYTRWQLTQDSSMSSVHPDRGDEDERRCVWVAEDDYIRLKEKNADLAAEVKRLEEESAEWRRREHEAVDKYAALAAENERLKASQLSLEKWIACEQAHFETADNLREKLYQASLEVERLRKLLEMYLKADPLIGEAVASAMLAAKEGSRK